MPNFSEELKIGAFRYRSDTHELFDPEGKPVSLRPQTSRVLEVLLDNSDQVVAKDDLIRLVWPTTHVTDDSLVQCISEIRKALGPEHAKRLVTIPKTGYRLHTSFHPKKPATDNAKLRRYIIGTSIVVLVTCAAFLGYLWFYGQTDVADRKTIAVLPFENVSDDENQEYFALGLAEDLLTDLSKINAVNVLSRESTFAYRQSNGDPGAIARNIGATHLIDGSVRREGDRIRINVRLIKTSTGENVWAERYDRELGDLFELQDEVRSSIVQALSIRLAPGEAERMRSGETTTVLAYDLLLQGRQAEAAFGRAGVTKAIDLYEQAIAIDPTYGVAYSRLANMYDFISRYGWSIEPARDAALAVKFAETGISLSSQNPFAYWTYGRVLSRRAMDGEEIWAMALQALQKAIELDPNYADAHAFVALLHIGNGNAREAKTAIDEAIRLNRNAPYWYLQNRGIIAYMEGEFETAISYLEKAKAQSPTTHFTRTWLAAAYARGGRSEDAEWELEEAILLGSPDTLNGVLTSNPIFRDTNYLEQYATGLRQAGLMQ